MKKSKPKLITPLDQHIAQRFRFRRMECGFSQEKVGDHLGLTFQQIQKYEKATNRIPSGRLSSIAALLNVPLTYFYEGFIGEKGDEAAITVAAVADPTHTDMAAFLSTREGFQLMDQFRRIKNTAIRQHVIGIVRLLAQSA